MEDGSIELLKWSALLLMTGDHINKYLFNEALPWVFDAGRLCLPIFIFVLAYNLARPGVLESGAYLRTARRLGIVAAISSIPVVALGGLIPWWWPLNVLFTLLALSVILYLLDQGGKGRVATAIAVFFVTGALVEFWWPALLLGIATWYFIKHQSLTAAIVAGVAIATLYFINGNHWALAAIPAVALASRVHVQIPRLRSAFYVYYPLHLSILWMIRFQFH
jgi:hypothetical protein